MYGIYRQAVGLRWGNAGDFAAAEFGDSPQIWDDISRASGLGSGGRLGHAGPAGVNAAGSPAQAGLAFRSLTVVVATRALHRRS